MFYVTMGFLWLVRLIKFQIKGHTLSHFELASDMSPGRSYSQYVLIRDMSPGHCYSQCVLIRDMSPGHSYSQCEPTLGMR